MTTWLATAGIVISGVALGISGLSALFARRQLQLAERSRGRDFEATVVAELVGACQDEDAVRYEIRVTNAGPAVARDVDVSLIEWGDTTSAKFLLKPMWLRLCCAASAGRSHSNWRMQRRLGIEMSRWSCTPTTTTTTAYVTSA